MPSQLSPGHQKKAQLLPGIFKQPAATIPATSLTDKRPQAQHIVQLQALAAGSERTAPVIQLQAIAAGQTAALQLRPNYTGLPMQLKQGIEQLSGHSMDDVKVHYNSAKPAQLKALAYAQGNHIHLAPGQEKHLPHEAWHIVQQKQDRVKPTTQLKSGTNINDEKHLEQEADFFADKIKQLSPVTNLKKIKKQKAVKAGVIQKKPRNAMNTVSKKSKATTAYSELSQILNNHSTLRHHPYKSDKTGLYEAIAKFISTLEEQEGSDFLTLWNNKLKRTDPVYVSQKALKDHTFEGRKKRKHSSATVDTSLSAYSSSLLPPSSGIESLPAQQPSYIMDDNKWAILNRWFDMPIAQKSMLPERKIGRLIGQANLADSELPEDFLTALKLFFVHTAGFSAQERQGRDINDEEKGLYYRTSGENPVRKVVKQMAMSKLEKMSPKLDMKGKTGQMINTELAKAVAKHGNLSDNISSMQQSPFGTQMNVGFYKSSQGSHVGSLGFSTNSVKSMRMLEEESGIPHISIAPSEPVGDEMQSLIGKINPELLKNTSGASYHDYLLQDRMALIRQITQWMRQQPSCASWNIQPIQSENHPSIIIHNNDLKEKEWRELFILEFNTASASMGYQTNLTRRGSFGFLFPTISSVGGPVRVWPGLVPAAIFQAIMETTLLNLTGTKTHHISDEKTAGAAKTEKTPFLHAEALRTAVNYTFGVLRTIEKRPKDTDVYQWILDRLQKNLLKAQFLLKDQDWLKINRRVEQHYLKSALVIENLMEYTYLLQGLVRSFNPPTPDYYPAHVQKMLLTTDHDKKHKKIRTFYFDSGMQAIVAANLLAKVHIEGRKKATGSQQRPATVLNLDSYFEYSNIYKGNLKLGVYNVKKAETQPDIIAADLNPVLTRPAQLNYNAKDEFNRYGKQRTTGITIPIIDITNSTLSAVNALDLGPHYDNYIVLESLTKHQQIGSDKFTMGRLNAVGSDDFLELAAKLLDPIADQAYDPLWMEYRLAMDREFYGQVPLSMPQAHQHKQTFGPPQLQKHLYALTSAGVINFVATDMGVTDYWGRGNSCGFLSLGTTREFVRDSLLHAVQSANYPNIEFIKKLLGEEINSIIYSPDPRIFLSSKYIQRLKTCVGNLNTAEQNSAELINQTKMLLFIPSNTPMNLQDAINQIATLRDDRYSQLQYKLTMAQHGLNLAKFILNHFLTTPDLISDYLTNNFADQQQLGTNAASAWAIANNIALHIWRDGLLPGSLYEINAEYVLLGAPVTIDMLHTNGFTHFQRLTRVPL